MDQNTKIQQVDINTLMWATLNIDELYQRIMQNAILVEYGFWKVLLMDSTDNEGAEYYSERQYLIDDHQICENSLRATVIDIMRKPDENSK